MGTGIRLSVVIPAYNEENYLGATLDSLHAAARRCRASGREVEFIVVDNASTDGTAAVAIAGGARVVREEKRCIAAVRNRGAREARGDIIATCDADNLVSENLLQRIDEAMSAGAAGGGVRIRPEPGPRLARAMYGLFDAMARVAGMSFGVIFTDRETYGRLGGFPESVYVGEDGLFVLALKREARKTGRPFANLRDAHIVTSLRKMREFGSARQALTYLKFVLLPWTVRRRESCRTWYAVRDTGRPSGA
ncbi:MAG: glycosyltransferase [Elusimicrobiota bacterium]